MAATIEPNFLTPFTSPIFLNRTKTDLLVGPRVGNYFIDSSLIFFIEK